MWIRQTDRHALRRPMPTIDTTQGGLNTMPDTPLLFLFSGLPGVGKTTLATRLARHTGSAYLRIDTIEQGLRDLCRCAVQGEGYRLAYRIACDNLANGISVVADCCNPISLTREEWHAVARQTQARWVDIEIHCSDTPTHTTRITTRRADIAGLVLPTWADVCNREYEPWKDTDVIRIDTAWQEPDESFTALLTHLGIPE